MYVLNFRLHGKTYVFFFCSKLNVRMELYAAKWRYVSVHMIHIWIRNKLLRTRTAERIRNSYICVCVPHVEFHICANNTKSSHLVKLQRKIDTVGLYVLIQNRNYTCKAVGNLFFLIYWVHHFVSLHYDLGITKTYLYNFDPLKPHFYIVKLGFTGVYIIFLISAQKHRLGVFVRTASPRRF